MRAQLIDGKAVAAKLRMAVAAEVSDLVKRGVKPGLAVVLVGEDVASQVYVRSKVKQTVDVGMASLEHRLPADTSEATLLALIERLNHDSEVDGILVQLPLPEQIDDNRVLRAIDPSKDVDGFHPINVGQLATGTGGIVPCTPLGSLLLLKSVCNNLAGLDAVIVGRSNIVGKPMAQLLLGESCTVTVGHSRSRDLPAICRRADILVAAVGRPEIIRGAWIKPDAIVIDVGINRIPTAAGKPRLVGDVAFAEASEVASAITPVPGGVGPMTIACLLRNTVEAARRRRGLA
ncbi:bifunctional methylenetetrahydrofolate dehydrogenase/methenyltetrahydrofolate cyclohydrolase FolD [Chelatococcus sp.]|uniref:bifunctional methylenetetrahydrofolate dehydrogenase/methenyltetrahydrofolate cyclohydrolase FolD n=1 Tax=Chelatococcus sp. TaxID=1953771 RepID=UPI0025BFD37C|nr:bifunctional methylenetetrahydrofolate dehydrogenase/methenyltetrahydrofolate cyclohydrolase FolD [Chelatococcus sp.]MBX3560099.1 bifunctional methylenetetrahydrofolate dehydrogenase/methenyltetrahydrofolate cyclohydrolase FolD [Chelatococcus sp.]